MTFPNEKRKKRIYQCLNSTVWCFCFSSFLNEKAELSLSETQWSLVKKKLGMQLSQEKIMHLDEKTGEWQIQFFIKKFNRLIFIFCSHLFFYGLKKKALNANKYTSESFNISSAKLLFSFIIERLLHFKIMWQSSGKCKFQWQHVLSAEQSVLVPACSAWADQL